MSGVSQSQALSNGAPALAATTAHVYRKGRKEETDTLWLFPRYISAASGNQQRCKFQGWKLQSDHSFGRCDLSTINSLNCYWIHWHEKLSCAQKCDSSHLFQTCCWISNFLECLHAIVLREGMDDQSLHNKQKFSTHPFSHHFPCWRLLF